MSGENFWIPGYDKHQNLKCVSSEEKGHIRESNTSIPQHHFLYIDLPHSDLSALSPIRVWVVKIHITSCPIYSVFYSSLSSYHVQDMKDRLHTSNYLQYESKFKLPLFLEFTVVPFNWFFKFCICFVGVVIAAQCTAIFSDLLVLPGI